MLAKDVMTTKVVTVLEDTPVDQIVRTLLRFRISAVPVVNADGEPVGIVSEGDLVRRVDADSSEGGSWWLSDLIAPAERARRFSKAHGLLAKDVMTAPAITASEGDTLHSLAALLEEKRIKRVPILRKGKLVGIVSRANLLHGVAAAPSYARRSEPARESRKSRADSAPADETIRAAILNTLHNDVGVGHHVNVIVANGTVDLWGGVETESERQAVRTAAENAVSVKAVRDHLSVFPASLRHLLGADRNERS
jgi:CBS-domain-containing membrane protein